MDSGLSKPKTILSSAGQSRPKVIRVITTRQGRLANSDSDENDDARTIRATSIYEYQTSIVEESTGRWVYERARIVQNEPATTQNFVQAAVDGNARTAFDTTITVEPHRTPTANAANLESSQERRAARRHTESDIAVQADQASQSCRTALEEKPLRKIETDREIDRLELEEEVRLARLRAERAWLEARLEAIDDEIGSDDEDE